MGWIWPGRLGMPQTGKKENKGECTHLAHARGPAVGDTRMHPVGVAVTACCCDEYAAQNASGKVLYRDGEN